MQGKEIEQLKQKLEEEKKKLIGELSSFAERNPHVPGDWNAMYPKFAEEQSGSHAHRDEEEDEVEEYEARLAMEHSLESRLLTVSQALERIEKNSYGTCKKCGKEIPMDRLQANPAAEFDMEHIDITSR
jgi:RNA polymerase-binding transcription factor DksA